MERERERIGRQRGNFHSFVHLSRSSGCLAKKQTRFRLKPGGRAQKVNWTRLERKWASLARGKEGSWKEGGRKEGRREEGRREEGRWGRFKL